MSGRSDVFLADLLRALDALDIRTPRTAWAVMQMLSLDDWQALAALPLRPADASAAAPEAPLPVGSTQPVAEAAPAPATDAAMPGAGPLPPGNRGPASVRALLPQELPPPAAMPAWLQVTAMPRAGRLISPPPAPLFEPRQQRALVGALAASRRFDGPPDLAALAEALSAGRPLAALPLEALWHTAGGLQVLVDDGPGMAPFRADVAGLLARLAELLPADGLRRLFFEGCPLRGCREPRRRGLRRWQAPAPGGAVLLVSDLGIAQADPPEARGTVAEWLAFARTAQTAGVQLRTLVPYPAARWPAALAGRLHALAWDRRTTAAQVRRCVADAARDAARGAAQ